MIVSSVALSLIHICKEETLDKAIQKCIPARKADMLEFNRKAVKLGAEQ